MCECRLGVIIVIDNYLSEFIIAIPLIIPFLGRCWVFFLFYSNGNSAVSNISNRDVLFHTCVVNRQVAVYINILGGGIFFVLSSQIISILYPLMPWFVFLIINICQTEE